jgi:hypothetical protein
LNDLFIPYDVRVSSRGGEEEVERLPTKSFLTASAADTSKATQKPS